MDSRSRNKNLFIWCHAQQKYQLFNTKCVISFLYHDLRLLHPNQLESMGMQTSQTDPKIRRNSVVINLSFILREHLEWFLFKWHNKQSTKPDHELNDFTIYSSFDDFANNRNGDDILKSFYKYESFCILDLCVQRRCVYDINEAVNRNIEVKIDDGDYSVQCPRVASSIISRYKLSRV